MGQIQNQGAKVSPLLGNYLPLLAALAQQADDEEEGRRLCGVDDVGRLLPTRLLHHRHTHRRHLPHHRHEMVLRRKGMEVEGGEREDMV